MLAGGATVLHAGFVCAHVSIHVHRFNLLPGVGCRRYSQEWNGCVTSGHGSVRYIEDTPDQ